MSSSNSSKDSSQTKKSSQAQVSQKESLKEVTPSLLYSSEEVKRELAQPFYNLIESIQNISESINNYSFNIESKKKFYEMFRKSLLLIINNSINTNQLRVKRNFF